MIQELFGGSNVGLINGDQRSKLSCNNNSTNTNSSVQSIFEQHNPQSHSSLSTSNNNTNNSPRHITPPSSSAANPNNTSENLRCPRCDSSNTKFCYYNNYNLTQPRHFCKTCRRYWTKGGALRNVPIGGACRKNRSPSASLTKSSTSAAGKLIKAISPEIGMLKSSSSSPHGLFASGFDQQNVDQYQIQNPILWAASSSHNSHLLSSLLRGNQNYSPNPNHYDVLASHSTQFASESNLIPGTNLPIQTSASIGLSTSIRNQQGQSQVVGQGQGIILGEVQSRDGLQELYHRLRSSSSTASNYFSSSSAANVACTTVLESGHAASSSSGELCSFMDSKFTYY